MATQFLFNTDLTYKLCASRVQMQVVSEDTAHGRLPWQVSPLATHAESEPLMRIIYRAPLKIMFFICENHEKS